MKNITKINKSKTEPFTKMVGTLPAEYATTNVERNKETIANKLIVKNQNTAEASINNNITNPKTVEGIFLINILNSNNITDNFTQHAKKLMWTQE